MSANFRVMYKLPEQRIATTTNLIMDDLQDLLKYLARDGITKESVEFLYVHYTPQNTNDTMELVSVENGKRQVTPPKKGAVVVPLTEVEHLRKARALKPRVSMKELPDMGLVMHGIYTAMRGDFYNGTVQ